MHKFCPKIEKFLIMVPLVKYDVTQQNFVFKSIQTLNETSKKILVKIEPNEMVIMVPDSIKNSDLTASIGFVKNKL